MAQGRKAGNIVNSLINSAATILPFLTEARKVTSGCDTKTYNSQGFTSLTELDSLVIDGNNVSTEGVQATLRMASSIIVTLTKATLVPGNSQGSKDAHAALGILREALDTIPTDPSIMEVFDAERKELEAHRAAEAIKNIDPAILRQILQNQAMASGR